MCLGIPGEVLQVHAQGASRMADVRFAGITREVCLDCVPETEVGDYVLVHVGFAIGTVDEEEAIRQYKVLEEMGELAELRTEEDLAPSGPEGAKSE